MKYLANFCDCGKIIFFDDKKINESVEKEERLLLICSSCNRKYNIVFKNKVEYYLHIASVYQDYDYSVYDTHIYSIKEKEVYMQTGQIANECLYGGFLDLNRDTDFRFVLRSKVDIEKTKKYITDEEEIKAIRRLLSFKSSNLEI